MAGPPGPWPKKAHAAHRPTPSRDARAHVRGDPSDQRAPARLAEMEFPFCELDHIQKRAPGGNGVDRTGAGGLRSRACRGVRHAHANLNHRRASRIPHRTA